ncbi:heavy metal-responsive transcriptional regulator [Phycicoccus sp. Root101]|uniref:heavy metal-responsive transcriptional regulator n=1 Tax=Phycicoccus sp. Root101 TaxID=1736421 RepID=UPI000703A85F|nr:heavy metal-responsive transcriptional regulator [Phycicoccus sp. Root101]KQU67403.1 MerR family transcriptional regulator [Phycicoccus sp. Root101]
MLIGELADAAGVSAQTVRLYERKGLLPDADRGANGYRVYDDSMLVRLRFIRVAQEAGLTLAEIRSIIEIRDDGTAPCAHVGSLIDTKLTDVRARIRHLAALQAELERLLGRSQALDPADCADDDICHILATAK